MASTGTRNRVLSITMKGIDQLSPVTRLAVRSLRLVGDAAMFPIRMIQSLTTVSGALRVALAGIAVGGVASFFTEVAAGADKIDELSIRTGISRQALQEWDHVGQKSGVTLDSMINGWTLLSDNVATAAATMKGPAVNALDRLGLSARELSALKPEEAFQRVADALGEIENIQERTRLSRDLFGKGGAEFLRVLNQGGPALRAMKQEAHDLGVVLSDLDISRAVAFDDRLFELKQSLRGLRNEVAIEFMPILASLASEATEFFKDNRGDVEAWAQSAARALRTTGLRAIALKDLFTELLNDPQGAEDAGELIQQIADYGLDVTLETAKAAVRIWANVLHSAASPLLKAVEVLGVQAGKKFWDGFTDWALGTEQERLEDLLEERRRLVVNQPDVMEWAKLAPGTPATPEMNRALEQWRDLQREIHALMTEIDEPILAIQEVIGIGAQEVARTLDTNGQDVEDAITNWKTGVGKASDELFSELNEKIGGVRIQYLGGVIPMLTVGHPALTKFNQAWADAAIVMDDGAESAAAATNALSEQSAIIPEIALDLVVANKGWDQYINLIREADAATRTASATWLSGRAGIAAQSGAAFENRAEEINALHLEQIQLLDDLHTQGAISHEQYLVGLTAADNAYLSGTEVALADHLQVQRELYGSFYDGFVDEGQAAFDELNNVYAAGQAGFNSMLGVWDSGVNQMIDDSIESTGRMSEAWDDMGEDILKVIAKISTRLLSLWVLQQFTGTGGFGANNSGPGTMNMFTGQIVPSAKGNVFHRGRLQRFAMGGIVTQPELFPMANGGLGLRGEAGPEAVMPLGRDGRGRLGVRVAAATSAAPEVTVHFNVNTIDAKSFEQWLSQPGSKRQIKSTVQEAMSTEQSMRRSVAKASRSN